MNRIKLMILLVIVGSGALFANVTDPTPAGTNLTTLASVSYNNSDGRTMQPSFSNTATIKVGQFLSISGEAAKSGDSLRPNSYSQYPIKFTNNGNGYDTFQIRVSTPAAGWRVRVIEDKNDNGVLDSDENFDMPKEGDAWVTGWLDKGGVFNALIELDSPAGTVVTDGTIVTVSITSAADGNTNWQTALVGGVTDDLQLKWIINLGEPINSGLTLSGNMLYAATSQGKLRAFMLSPGSAFEMWAVAVPNAHFIGTPVIQGNSIYAPMTDRRLAQFDLTAHSFKRFITTPGGFVSGASPLIIDRKLVAAAAGAKIAGIQSDGGSVSSTDKLTNGELTTAPALLGRTLYAGGGDGSLVALDSVSMRPLWRMPVESGSALISTPVIDAVNNLLYISAADGNLCCVSLLSRNVRWRFNPGSQIVSTTRVDALTQNIYFVTKDRHVWGLNGLNGQTVIGFPATLSGTGDLSSAAVTIKRNDSAATPYIWLGTSDGRVFALNALNGYTFYNALGGALTGTQISVPVAVNLASNLAFAATSDGKILAFTLR